MELEKLTFLFILHIFKWQWHYFKFLLWLKTYNSVSRNRALLAFISESNFSNSDVIAHFFRLQVRQLLFLGWVKL